MSRSQGLYLPADWRGEGHDGQWHPHRAGIYVPQTYREPKLPTGLSLFSGAGGFDLGMHQAGYNVLAGAEWDCAAAHTYLWNLGTWPMHIEFVEEADRDRFEKYLERRFKKHLKQPGFQLAKWIAGGNRPADATFPPVRYFFFGDISKLTGDRILSVMGLQRGDIDVVFGGPPCQGYSMGGKRNVVDPRNSLVFEFARLVLEINPTAFVLENVPGMVSMTTPEGIPVIDAFARVIADGGFGAYNALRKSLRETAGVGAAVKGNPESVSGSAVATDDDEVEPSRPVQPSLFDVAAGGGA